MAKFELFRFTNCKQLYNAFHSPSPSSAMPFLFTTVVALPLSQPPSYNISTTLSNSCRRMIISDRVCVSNSLLDHVFFMGGALPSTTRQTVRSTPAVSLRNCA
uniref:Uncharacterized protein n=1 Tax=Cacopsylla melanoneura TaxID=428564 RepID=A0A8D9EAP8_9HEMI